MQHFTNKVYFYLENIHFESDSFLFSGALIRVSFFFSKKLFLLLFVCHVDCCISFSGSDESLYEIRLNEFVKKEEISGKFIFND